MEKKYTPREIIEMIKIMNDFQRYRGTYCYGDTIIQKMCSSAFLTICQGLREKVPKEIIEGFCIQEPDLKNLEKKVKGIRALMALK